MKQALLLLMLLFADFAHAELLEHDGIAIGDRLKVVNKQHYLCKPSKPMKGFPEMVGCTRKRPETLLGVPVEKVLIGFKDGRCWMIHIEFSNTVASKIGDALVTKYGKPKQAYEVIKDVYLATWMFGSRSIGFTRNGRDGTAQVQMTEDE